MDTHQPESLSFDKVYKEEWKEIRERRIAHYYPTSSLGNDKNSPESLVGLALSGGGIRSATFCLGVLQGMHKLRLLRVFDYLSTVSGGGYVGGWWSAWLSRNDIYARTSDDKSPKFQDHDIKNASSLAVKLSNGKDKASKCLRNYFETKTRAELAKHKDGDYPSTELKEVLLKELCNAQIPRFKWVPYVDFFTEIKKVKFLKQVLPDFFKESIKVKQIKRVPPNFFQEIKKVIVIKQVPLSFFKEIKKVKLLKQVLPDFFKESIKVKQIKRVPPNFFQEIKKVIVIKRVPLSFFQVIKKLMEETKKGEEIRKILSLIANDERRFRWLNRILLEEAYPYELKDIFPPREGIEPVRWKDIRAERSSDSQVEVGKETETALCAWQDPIHHLRLFANYLTPRRGALSADTWRAVSTITRNLTLTWFILLPILIAVVLIGQSYFLLSLGSSNFLGVVPGGHSSVLNMAPGVAPVVSPDATSNEISAVIINGTRMFSWPARGAFFWGVPNNAVILKAIVIPLAAILGVLVVLALAWLFCNRDSTSSVDLIIQFICMGAVLFMVAAGVNVYKPISEFVSEPIFWVSMSLAIGLFVYMVLWNPGDKGIWAGDHAMKAQWAKEVRRNRISRWQTRFQIIFVAVAIVLIISGFSGYLQWTLFSKDSWLGMKFAVPLSVLPVISAVAGSIFTAMKTTPTGGGDKRETREPSAISRFIFAATPILVILVLAIGVALAGNALLTYIWEPSNTQGAFSSGFSVLKSVAALFGVILCLALALYEMDVDIKPSLVLIPFGLWLIFLASWTVFTLRPFLLGERNALYNTLFYSVIIITAAVGFMIFIRIVVEGKWKIYLKLRHWIIGLISTLVIALAGALPAELNYIYHWVCWKTPGGLMFERTMRSLNDWASVHLDLIPRALPLVLSALAFSFVMFRFGVKRSEGSPPFKLKFFRHSALGRKPESLSLYAYLCLMIPVAAVCWLRALQLYLKPDLATVSWIALMAFPLIIAPLPEVIILLYRMSNKRRVNKGEHAPGENPGQPNQAPRKVPAVIIGLLSSVRQYRERVAGYLVIVSLGVILFAGFAAKSQINESALLPDLVVLLVAFTSSMALFTVVLTQQRFLPQAVSSSATGTTESQVSKPGSYWMLILACVGLTISVGYLMHLISPHVIEIASLSPSVIEEVAAPLFGIEKGLLSPPVIEQVSIAAKGIEPYFYATPLATAVLPGMAICLTIIFAEMYWGKSENRHSIWLVLATYAALFLLLMISIWHTLDPDHREFINSLNSVLGLLAVALVWVVALGWMVDPNSVSMHQFYRARLVRAYLGASNIRRRKQGKEITEAAPGDDLPLSSVKTCRRGGPHHLLNTTMNLVGGRDLATAQRSASNFVLSSSFCGSLRTNYRPTSEYMNGKLTLGTAVAASGAAVSPSMGAKKPTAALAMLLTLLNVRLGYWAPTPNRDNWTSSQPKLWPFYLMREFLSQTNDVSSYCYLTDGGHFDNTGLYSLVERGCRFIVLVDCAADPEPACFQDLGDAIRRCRIDFGTEIKLNLDPFIKSRSMNGFQPFAVGGIRYSHKHAKTLGWYSEERLKKLLWKREPDEYSPEDKDYRSGTIIYFKPSIMGKETADVRQYAIENKDFPQQATTNQWFDEAQFESYRRLGQFCAKLAFEGLESVQQIQYKAKLLPADIKAIFDEISEKESTARSQASMEDYFDWKPREIRTAC